MSSKYIFVTGGVVSGLGKGITAASLGRLLKARGANVTMQKLDPYINVDPGTMNPIQHGEVFVTEDGTETDLDLGHYERFIDENLNKNSNITTGKVYSSVLKKEREGFYGGGTVQVIPHITNEIKEHFIYDNNKEGVNVSIIEVGGTVGDIESQPYLEAIRQFIMEAGPNNCMLILVSLVPYLKCSKELKSKPTQMAVRTMQQMGLRPDVIVCRSEVELTDGIKEKIAHFCNVDVSHVIENLDMSCLYEAPLAMEKEGLAKAACEILKINDVTPKLSDWEEMVDAYLNPIRSVKVALVGKYVELEDAYLSVVEALKAGGIAHRAKVDIEFVDAETINEENVSQILGDYNGIIVPGGFGERGIAGMIYAIKYARTKDIPYLGICLGMQLSCIEFARNVCKLEGADSVEFNEETKYPVIHLMPEQEGVTEIGGTLRLGSWPCILKKGSLAQGLYKESNITERHRHRYEFNNEFRETFEKNKMSLCGMSPDERIVEMIELSNHPFFIATQAHPEFKSRPNKPHPLFKGFIGACVLKEN